jgi:hypothetical protein
MSSEALLPEHILARASVRGNEFSWRVVDISDVIEAAKVAQLVNIGGQLQFRLSNGFICECYWVEVDTHRDVPSDLVWPERVSRSAEVAHSQFQQLCKEFDFVAEGRSAYAPHLQAFEAQGGDINEAACFVWYVQSQVDAANHQG